MVLRDPVRSEWFDVVVAAALARVDNSYGTKTENHDLALAWCRGEELPWKELAVVTPAFRRWRRKSKVVDKLVVERTRLLPDLWVESRSRKRQFV